MKPQKFTVQLVQHTMNTALLQINGVTMANYVTATEEQRQRACDAWLLHAIVVQDPYAPRHIDVIEDYNRRHHIQHFDTLPNVKRPNYPIIRWIDVTLEYYDDSQVDTQEN